jgi:hypothetical protein
VLTPEEIARGALTLTLPMPDPLSNASGRSRHWRTVNRAKKAYWARLDELQNVGIIPAPPRHAIASATLRSVMHLGGHMDEDGAVSRHKWPLDWLVSRGYLVTDRRTGLRWEAFPEQVVKRDGNYRLVLTLTPVALSTIAYKRRRKL